MTGMVNVQGANIERARRNFALIVSHLADLYCMGRCSSISANEAHELAESAAYVLGITDATPEEAARVLDVRDPLALWRSRLAELDARMDAVLRMWSEIIAIMPPIRNVSLRDTLASLGELRCRYDMRFAAHEVPCDIDYQLSTPVEKHLLGIDYLEAWLTQLLTETRWIARFDVTSCISVLERVCPDYRGLHVNLYDLLLPHEQELAPASRAGGKSGS